MAQATEQDAWTETFLITIQQKGGTAQDFRAIVTTYDISGGDKDFTSIANAKGGRVKNFAVQTDYEVTLEGYATQAGNGEGFFDLQFPGTADSTQPLSYPVDHSHTQFLLSLMHTTDTSATSAVDASTQDERALRDTFKNGHFTMVNQSFTDGICKFTIKFKAAPFDKAAAANVTFESTDGSATSTLPAITYT
jgi:hypothetical protein